MIAPWREWNFKSRTDLIAFAEAHQIPVAKDKRGEAPFSVDANLLHSSSEGKVLEDPWVEPPPYVYQRTIAPEDAPDRATYVEIAFRNGDPLPSTASPCRPPCSSPNSTGWATTMASAASIWWRTASSA